MSSLLKPRFGIDIDGTVTCPATLIPHINKQYNTSITLNDVVEYDFLSAFRSPVDRNEFNAWFKENEPTMYKVSELAAHAKSVLQSWESKFELYYISARGENVYDITYDWFNEHHIPFDRIELIGSHDNAVMIAEQLKIPVILFDTPYNRMPVPQNVIRVENWLQANEWINRIF